MIKLLRKRMKNSNKGITLIALIVSVIVLLLIAGVSIAMLRGDNGVLTRSREARHANIIASFDENVKLASMSVATAIESNITKDPDYIATSAEGTKKLAEMVATDLGLDKSDVIEGKTTNTQTIKKNGYTVAYYLDSIGTDYSEGHTYISIWYTENSLREKFKREEIIQKYGVTDIAENKNSKQVVLVCVIKVEDNECTISTKGLTSQVEANEDLAQESLGDTTIGKNNLVNVAIVDIPTNESYVGCYADIDDDGTVDGIIFADLAISKEESIWNPSGNASYNNNGKYSWTAQTKLKNYYVKQKNYTGKFGTANVIAPTGTGWSNDRFYVMALTNMPGGSSTWYKDAYDSSTSTGKMTDYESFTSVEFGSGKENTRKMLAKWKGTEPKFLNPNYGTPDNGDLWKKLDDYYAISEDNKRWFVPSRKEWAAFAGELGVNKTENDEKNYVNLGLGAYYWSSSQYSTYRAWFAYFNYGFMNYNTVGNSNAVRLATTF